MTDEFDFRKAKKEVLNPNMDKYVDEIVRVCRKWFRGIDSPSPRVPQLEQEIQQQIRKAQRDAIKEAEMITRECYSVPKLNGIASFDVPMFKHKINQLKEEQG